MWAPARVTAMRVVLVVDDEPKIVQVVRDYLQRAGYGVRVAHDGKSALAVARSEKPDMIILDLGLPPGFSLVTDKLDQLKENKIIEKYTSTGRQLTLYVRRLEKAKPLTFTYQLKAKFPVKALAPASKIYEYYNPATKAETKPFGLEVTK